MANFELQQQSPAFLGFVKQVLQAHWRSLLLLGVGVGLPLFLFEQLAVAIWQHQGGFLWDEPILLTIHGSTTQSLDRLAPMLTKLGGFKGVTLMTTLLSLWLLWQQRWRSLIYLLTTTIGSGVINRIAKVLLHRVRPSLWESLSPEPDFAFPSGHATASMTLVAALIILTWGTRWSWLVCLGGSSFVVTIAWTRLYLGVHFPSDILAGWFVSIAWAIGISLVIRPHLAASTMSEEVQLTTEETQTIAAESN
ncbi:phosphatase PAP2 family protein [Pantanalinema rosaneae CENA516]|uniref:phosphatase PAP2 family protein n=1 Tax=Pantanalinema rosaneae TaxID=1620701 RepID=UPI003D6DFE35